MLVGKCVDKQFTVLPNRYKDGKVRSDEEISPENLLTLASNVAKFKLFSMEGKGPENELFVKYTSCKDFMLVKYADDTCPYSSLFDTSRCFNSDI